MTDGAPFAAGGHTLTMEFDKPTAIGAFLLLVAVGVGGLLGAGVMPQRIVLMMVLPSMLVFGGLSFWLGVQLGEHRATH
jgi:hypothetical protein